MLSQPRRVVGLRGAVGGEAEEVLLLMIAGAGGDEDGVIFCW